MVRLDLSSMSSRFLSCIQWESPAFKHRQWDLGRREKQRFIRIHHKKCFIFHCNQNCIKVIWCLDYIFIKTYFVVWGTKVQLGEKNLHLLIFLTE